MIPGARQRVCVKGRSGVFYVLTVNQDIGYADLVELNSATLVEAVRFESILPFPHVIEPYERPSSLSAMR
jgi:hypothetical protein